MLDHKFVIFYHLAKTPNTTKVAEELSLSQPAISKSIKELEKDLGITLFNREKGRLQLTEAGEYLLSETTSLLHKEREIEYHIGQMKNTFSGTLRIGASTTLSQYILPEILAKFAQSRSGIDLLLESGNTEQIENEIVTDNLQIAFIEGNPTRPDIRYIPFIRDEIVLACASNAPVPEQITKDELAKLSFVFRERGSGTYHVIKKQLKENGIDIHDLPTQLLLGSTEGIKHYLLYSGCCALLSVYSIREELSAGKLRIVDIDNFSIERMFYAIHRQGEPDLYARKFLDFTLNHFSKH